MNTVSGFRENNMGRAKDNWQELQALDFDQTGFDDKGNVVGAFCATGAVPEFVQTLRRRGIEVDLSIFQENADPVGS